MPLIVKLVRHGESESNTGKMSAQLAGDHIIPLTARGIEQAKAAGKAIGRDFFTNTLVYSSPYQRTRSTLAGILEGAGIADGELRTYEDPRLREVEHGYQSYEEQLELRRTHGWFYYRFEGGESPADCFDRTSNFLESMMRQVERKSAERVLIVTHGLTIRCFVMRYLHLKVEEFDELANPDNCAIITLGEHAHLPDAAWKTGKWGVTGLHPRAD